MRHMDQYHNTPPANTGMRVLATPSSFARDTFFYVQEIGQIVTTADPFIKRKLLPSYLIACTEAGAGYLQYQDNHYQLRPGDVFFIDCNIPHSYGALFPKSWHATYLHIYGASTVEYYDMFTEDGNHVLNFGEDDSILSHIHNLLDMMPMAIKEYEMLASLEMTGILTKLVVFKDQYRRSKRTEFVLNAMRYIEERFRDDITLQTLSSRFRVSKFHLQKKFKQYTGTSPNEYLIRIRLQKAKEYLRNTDMPVHEIAVAVGMENVSYFIKIFKDNEHLTPLSYRKRWGDMI